MPTTPLLEALTAHTEIRQPLARAEYRGASVAAGFSDPQIEFAEVLKGCGVYDLGYRAQISLAGSDRVRWLNGMVTNNIRDLGAGHVVYAFLLNPQGRILGDMYVRNLGESLVVETDRSQVEKILATFDHYIIMDDVIVTDISEQQTCLGLAGPRSRSLLNAVGIEVGERQPGPQSELQPFGVATPRCTCDCDCTECTVIRGGEAQSESYEIWLDSKDVLKTWRALLAAGATPVGSEALEMLRIVKGVPVFGVDIRDRDLPQETEQMHALNFNKGCYVGQEIVERIRSRGNVHRKFTGFVAEGAASISAGAKIVSNDKEVGEITSATILRSRSGERGVGLGYIRREVGVPGREVSIVGAKATVVQLPMDALALGEARDAVVHAG